MNIFQRFFGKKEDSTPQNSPTETAFEAVKTELIEAQKALELMKTAMQDIDNQRISIQKAKEDIEKETEHLRKTATDQIQYFNALNARYGDFLKKARKTDESDPEQIKKLWHIVVAMSFHHYDYMKMICNDINWREVQHTNIQMIENQSFVNDLPLEKYVPYSDNPREIELHFRVLRRLLQQVGIDKLEDVLLSGVRIP